MTETARQKVESIVVDDTGIYRSFWPQAQAIDAVTAALMQERVENEYNLDRASGARSEWVLSFPTRRHYVDPALMPSASQPFPAPFAPPGGGTPVSCVASSEHNLAIYNREQGRPFGSIFPLPALYPLNFCRATVAITLAITHPGESAPSLFGSTSAELISTLVDGSAFESGFIKLPLDFGETRPALGGERYHGLPAIGFWAFRERNAGNSSNAARPTPLGRSGTLPHLGKLRCSKLAAACDRL